MPVCIYCPSLCQTYSQWGRAFCSSKSRNGNVSWVEHFAVFSFWGSPFVCIPVWNIWKCSSWNCSFGLSILSEVSALFEAGTSITYIFQEPYPVTKNASTSSSAIYADAITSKENIAFSFLTAHAPSLLLYINTYFHEYLAVILSKNGKYSWFATIVRLLWTFFERMLSATLSALWYSAHVNSYQSCLCRFIWHSMLHLPSWSLNNHVVGA